MIRLICDKCGKDCDLNALDIMIHNIHNPVPHSLEDVGRPQLTSSGEHKRFLLCSDCYRALGLPNVYEEGLVFRTPHKKEIV